LRWTPSLTGTKQDWQDRFRSIKFGRKGIEDTEKVENSAMSVPFYDENLYLLNMKNDLGAKVAFYMLNSLSMCTVLRMKLNQLHMDPVYRVTLFCYI